MVRYITVAVLLTLTCVAGNAYAQASRSGPTFNIGGTTFPVEFPDVAHDSARNRYLQVAGKEWIEANLMDSAGTVIARQRVNQSANYAQNPRVAFSPHLGGGAGGYLVTWHESVGNFGQARGRFLNGDGIPTGTDIDISPLGTSWIMGAAVEYATASQEFLIAWMGDYGLHNDIMYQRIGVNGSKLGDPVRLTTASPDWERDPSVAYNPHTNQFYIAYAGYNNAHGYSYVAGRLIQAGTGQPVGGAREFAATVATYVPSVIYNTVHQQYLVAWYHQSGSGQAVYGQLLQGTDGSPVGGLRILSPHYSSYDALDMDFNALAGEYVLVTHGSNHEVAGVTILSDGNPYDNGFVVTSTDGTAAGAGNFHPRIVSSRVDKRWLVGASYRFTAAVGQFVSSNSSGGGGGDPAPPPPPPPSTSDPRMHIDSPANHATLAGHVSLSGWAIDLGAATGDGVEAVHVYAWPTNGGSPIFVGSASSVSRPDVGAAFGDSRFSTGGFTISNQVPAGTYYVVAYALSTVAGTFNNERAIQVTVTPPLSIPRMAVDLPWTSQSVSRNFRVSGWALDAGSSFGTGVNAVHVWAYPVAGGDPVFVGVASLGGSRPDVGAAFGASRYEAAGFNLEVAWPHATGEYNLVVFARSSITGTFNNAKLVPIHVR